MNTYIVESLVNFPRIIEAHDKNEAKELYLNSIGYETENDLIEDVGFKFSIIEVEELVSEKVIYH